MKVVAHFIRKSSQLKASFIQNQILNHIDYKPVIIYKYKSENKGEGFADFNNNSIPVLNLNESPNFISIIKYKLFKKITTKDVTKINDFLKNNNVDVLHFHYGTDAGIYEPFLKQNRIPSVVSFYGYDRYSFPKKYFGYGNIYLKSRVFKYINKVLCMTEEMKKSLIKIGCPEENTIVHYHGVPAKYFCNSSNIKINNNGKITFFIHSYLDPVKGHIFILKSLKYLLERGFDNFEFRIAGIGYYKKVIEKEITRNKLNNYVKFIGKLNYASPEFSDELFTCDIYLHPSVKTKKDEEGVPGAIVEAMFTKLPVISTFHGGIPYIIENNVTGLLVKEWDVKDLAEKILLLANSSELRKSIGENAQKYAVENLDLGKREKYLEKIYNDLII